MKKLLLCTLIFAVAIGGCKKGKEEGAADIVLTKKYARYRIAVYTDKELKTWLATLDKAEPVDLIGQEDVTIKTKTVTLASIKLSTEKKGYVKADALADRPVVFTEDTKARVRNNAAARVWAIIPKGTIGFVIDEKADWVQIHVGKINDKWVTKHWVKNGFSGDENLMSEALDFEREAAVLAKGEPGSAKYKAAEEAIKKIESESTSIFKDMAGELLQKSSKKEEDQKETPEETDMDKDKTPEESSEGC